MATKNRPSPFSRRLDRKTAMERRTGKRTSDGRGGEDAHHRETRRTVPA